MSAEEHPAKAEMEEFAKVNCQALAKASDEQLQSCAATLQKKAGDHVYLDTVGVAAAFATMTRMVDGTGHSANLMATTMAKHVTNSVVQVKRSLRRRWLLVLLGGILAGSASSAADPRPLPSCADDDCAHDIVSGAGSWCCSGLFDACWQNGGSCLAQCFGHCCLGPSFPGLPAYDFCAAERSRRLHAGTNGRHSETLLGSAVLGSGSPGPASGPGPRSWQGSGRSLRHGDGGAQDRRCNSDLPLDLAEAAAGGSSSQPPPRPGRCSSQWSLDASAWACAGPALGSAVTWIGDEPLRKVHLLSGSAYEVRGCPDLRDFKQALSKELGHPGYLLTLLSDGAAITCNDEWQRLDSSKHLVAVQSCPFTDFVTDFDQDLIEASTAGDISRAEELLAKGQRPDADVVRGRHHAGTKPLHLAAEAGNADLARLLIQARAAINGGRCDKTPLQLACQNGQPTVLAVLVEAGADINAANRCGKTPLQLACAGGHYQCVYNLLFAAADVNHTANSGRTPLQLACEFGHIDVIKLLIRAGADIRKKGIHGGTPLQITCEKGYLEAVRLLIRAGADINAASRYSRTALQLACEQGHIEVVTHLIEQRADVTSQRNYGRLLVPTVAHPGHWHAKVAAADASEEFGAGFVSGWLSATVGSAAALLGLGQDRRLGLALLAWFLHLQRSAADLSRIAERSRPGEGEGGAAPKEASVRLLFLIDNFRSLVAMAVWSFLGRPLERLVTWMLPGRLRVFAFEAPIDDLGGLLQAGVCLMLEGSSLAGSPSPGHVVCNVGHLPTADDEDLRATVRSSLKIMEELSGVKAALRTKEVQVAAHPPADGFVANLLCVLPKPGRRGIVHPGWQSVREVNLSVWSTEEAAVSWYRKSDAHAAILSQHKEGKLRTFGNLLLTLNATKVAWQRRCKACAAVVEGFAQGRCHRCGAATYDLPAF
ncbi:Ankyrin-2 [Symbiodinium microadriaticum]|uniref:Ankyrin-2 n=1 Tax=Symbiodinium microadriaticum TaxID=2951 RepID=A0A1Q9CLH9_SYMMI|nr:Ankyrin-2 [Symbiodinium microadriaticum]